MLKINLYKYVSKKSSLILLYHATFKESPVDLKLGLHNVQPDVIFDQLNTLKKYYQFLTLDEWFSHKGRPGTAALTFDDGYESVMSEALPVLENLRIPATIFINGCTLNGEITWRDKIRYLINTGLVSDFIQWAPNGSKIKLLEPESFYLKTKREFNSKEISDFVSQYFKINNINLNTYCINDFKKLIDHPLLTYGNHTLNHYVLSTLSYQQQFYEINENKKLIEKHGINLSKIFSVPFGSNLDLNNHTIDICKKLSYSGLLLSRNRLNRDRNTFDNFSYGERFMVPSSVIDMITKTNKLFVKSLLKYSN